MKNALMIICVLSMALATAACGGGGGGGGGGSSRNAGFTQQEVGKISGVFVTGTKTQEHLSQPLDQAGGYFITKTADGLTLTTNRYVDARTIHFSALKDDFKDDPNLAGYLLAMKQTNGTVGGSFPGSFVAVDAVRLGGKKLGLRYADFGNWANNVTYALANSSLASSGHNVPFFMGDPDKKANFSASSGTITFSGKTLAAYNSDLLMEGTADLSIDTASLANSDLALSFPDFYRFNVPVGVGTDGKITSDMSGATLTPTGTPRDTVYSVQGGGYVDGQFYGDAPSNPTEAAGAYKMYLEIRDSSGNSMWRDLNGSFGLKRR